MPLLDIEMLGNRASEGVTDVEAIGRGEDQRVEPPEAFDDRLERLPGKVSEGLDEVVPPSTINADVSDEPLAEFLRNSKSSP